MNKVSIFLLKVILVVFVLFYRFYSSDAIEGFVYDAETNQPLGEVEVKIYWSLNYGIILPMGRTIERLGTKTDKNGYFYFPPWGPKLDGRHRFSGPKISFDRENYEHEVFGSYQNHYDFFFLDSWVIIGRTEYGYDNIDKKIRLRRLKPNAKK